MLYLQYPQYLLVISNKSVWSRDLNVATFGIGVRSKVIWVDGTVKQFTSYMCLGKLLLCLNFFTSIIIPVE